MTRRLVVPLVVLLTFALWPGAAAAQGTCTKNWTGSAADGVWETPGNWAPSGAPGAGDRACISTGATVSVQNITSVGSIDSDGTLEITGGLSVTDAATPSQVRGLALRSGWLDGAGVLNVSDTFAWTGGNMNGSSQTVLGSGVVGSIALASETSSVTFSERTLINRGTLTFTRGQVNGRDGARIENEGTFRINAESGGGLLFAGGAAATFVNTGTVEKTAGSGRSAVGFRFDNRGSVVAQSGELAFSGGVTAPASDGSWTGSDDARINFDGGVFSVGRWELAGNIKNTGAVIVAAGLTGSQADVEIAGGQLYVTDTADPSQVRGLVLSGGALDGAGMLNVSNTFAWTGGNMYGSGQTVLGFGVVGTITLASETADVTLQQRTLVNAGTLTLTRGQINGRDGASVANEGTFRINAESAGGLMHAGGAAPTFVNTGTVEKTAGSGRSAVGFRFDNRGSVVAQSGELAFSGGVTAPASDGSWTGSDDARIKFDGGVFSVGRWELAGNIKNTGAVIVAAGLTGPEADVDIAGGQLYVTDTADPSQVRGLVLSGGALDGAGMLNVSGTFAWTGGNMYGSGQTVLGSDVVGTITLASETSAVTLQERRLINSGTLTFTRGQLNGRDATRIDNSGTFTARDGARFVHTGGTPPLLINRGLLVKAGGPGTVEIGFNFANSGTVREDSGTFSFTGSTVSVPADTPPEVSFPVPEGGAAVDGAVDLRAQAADQDGVARVVFLVDGNTIGEPDTTAPYRVDWDSREVDDGTHQLTAVARDTTGTEATSEIEIEVLNTHPLGPDTSFWDARSADEQRVITNHFFQATGHPAPYTAQAASAQRVTTNLRAGTPASEVPAAATTEWLAATKAKLLPPPEEMFPRLFRGTAVFAAVVGIQAEVDLGLRLYAEGSMNVPADATTVEPFDRIEYWPSGNEIYFGARSRGEYLFLGGYGPIRWFEEPCTYSGFAPPPGARMRMGVTTTAQCRYPVDYPPYFADAAVFVDYPYLTLFDLIIQDYIKVTEYEPGRSDYDVAGVPGHPPVSGVEEQIEALLEGEDSEEFRHRLLVAIVTERIERNNPEPLPDPDPDDEPLPAPPIVREAADRCIKFVELAELPTSKCGSPELPMFVAGGDYPEVTGHIEKALGVHPEWVLLRYLQKGRTGRGWYRNYPQSDPALDQELKCAGTRADNTACDEFPFWQTEQGGDIPPPNRPHIEIINASQNSGQGSKWRAFKDKCALQARRTAPPQFGLGFFLVIPAPAIPTFGICNGKL